MPRLEVVRFGVFELDLRARELRRNGRHVYLQDKPCELLTALLERPGEVVTREELRQRLWATDTFVAFDDGLNTAAAKVREALGDSSKTPRFLQTIPRRGYRWIASVEPVKAAPESMGAAERVPEAVPVTKYRPRGAFPWAFGCIVACVLIALATLPRRDVNVTPVLGQFEIGPPANTVFANEGLSPNAALSPDGRQLLFVARGVDERKEKIWIRPLSSTEARSIDGTEGAWAPFWSPDGQRVGFVADRKLKTVDVRSQVVVTIADAPAALSGTWNGRDEIVFGPSPAGTLVRVPAGGGAVVPITAINRTAGERRHVWPQYLTDGRHVLYLAQHEIAARNRLIIASTESADTRDVGASETAAAFAAPGHLLVVRDGVLFAQPVSLRSMRPLGAPTVITKGVGVNVVTGRTFLSVSSTGALAFSDTRRLPLFQLTWFDDSGRRLDRLSTPISSRHIALSPDERLVAIEAEDPLTRDPDLWILDTARGTRSRVVGDPVQEEGTIWSPDGRRLAYARHRANQAPADLYTATLSGETSRTLSIQNASVHPTDWSAARNAILYEVETPDRGADIYALAPSQGSTPIPVVASAADDREGHVSPDGRWVAYSNDESGRRVVYIRSFDRDDKQAPVAVAAGTSPRWRGDGQMLFFATPERAIASVRVRTVPRLTVDQPRTVVDLSGLISREVPVQYAVSRDAHRFLVATVDTSPRSAPINVVMNWTTALPHVRRSPLFSSLLPN